MENAHLGDSRDLGGSRDHENIPRMTMSQNMGASQTMGVAGTSSGVGGGAAMKTSSADPKMDLSMVTVRKGLRKENEEMKK